MSSALWGAWVITRVSHFVGKILRQDDTYLENHTSRMMYLPVQVHVCANTFLSTFYEKKCSVICSTSLYSRSCGIFVLSLSAPIKNMPLLLL